MKIIILAALFGFASCGLLPNSQYLPSNQHGSGRTGGYHGGAGANAYQGGEGGFDGSSHGFSGHKNPENDVPILKFANENNGDGSYRYSYETGNGIQANEEGYLNNAGSDAEAQTVHGSYSYTGPDGHVYTVTYVADENGFRADGEHLPTPPPIPEAILKSLEQNHREEQYAGHGNYQSGHSGNGNFKPEVGYNY